MISLLDLRLTGFPKGEDDNGFASEMLYTYRDDIEKHFSPFAQRNINIKTIEVYMSHGKFATVINCMDGRTQLPANDWIKETFKVDYVDTITEAGPDGILVDPNHPKVAGIKERVKISVEKHGSKVVCLVAHHDCAGNPVSYEEHIKNLKTGINTIKSWGFDIQITPIWIDEKWQVLHNFT